MGTVSGAHLNPAVTIGFCVAGRVKPGLVIPYIVSQLSGAALASLLLRLMFSGHPTLGATMPSGSAWQSFVLELVLTFLLMLVVLQVSSGSKETGVMAGIAIGGVVALEAMFAGPICGASMNPARSIAPAIFCGQWSVVSMQWIYIAAPILGAILSVWIHHTAADVVVARAFTSVRQSVGVGILDFVIGNRRVAAGNRFGQGFAIDTHWAGAIQTAAPKRDVIVMRAPIGQGPARVVIPVTKRKMATLLDVSDIRRWPLPEIPIQTLRHG